MTPQTFRLARLGTHNLSEIPQDDFAKSLSIILKASSSLAVLAFALTSKDSMSAMLSTQIINHIPLQNPHSLGTEGEPRQLIY